MRLKTKAMKRQFEFLKSSSEYATDSYAGHDMHMM